MSAIPVVQAIPQPAVPQPAGVVSRPPVRVLHVINGEHYAGAERVQDLLALRLPAEGFEVGFVSLKPGLFGDVRQSVQAELFELEKRRRWDLRAALDIEKLIYGGDYQLLHAHTPRSLMVAAIAARRTATPLVYHAHSPTSRDSTRRLFNWLNDRVERFCIRQASRIIAVAPAMSRHLESTGVGSDRIDCVLNGTPVQQGAAPRTAPSGPWTIGMVALFRPRKGAEVLLHAIAALRQVGRDVRLRAVGPFETPAYEESLIALVNRLGIADAVHWTGFTERVDRELNQIDVLALPSLFGEGLPMVVLEAMASGLPVVATPCEGVVEAVDEGKTGLLVEPADAGALAAALERIVSGGLAYSALSGQAIARHSERFSDVVMARNVAEVYRRVLR